MACTLPLAQSVAFLQVQIHSPISIAAILAMCASCGALHLQDFEMKQTSNKLTDAEIWNLPFGMYFTACTVGGVPPSVDS